MMENFNKTFGFEPSKHHYAMPPEYKPELYTTELFTDTEKAQYWQCISEIQWAVALYQINIMCDTVVVSRYRPDPRKGHLPNIHHLYGYLNKYTSASINFNTETPD